MGCCTVPFYYYSNNIRGKTIANAWSKLHNILKLYRVSPKTYILDNETSKDLISSFKDE